MLLMDACTKPKGRDGGGDERGGGEETWPAFAPHITLPEGWEEWIWVEVGGWGEGQLRGGWGAVGSTWNGQPWSSIRCQLLLADLGNSTGP